MAVFVLRITIRLPFLSKPFCAVPLPPCPAALPVPPEAAPFASVPPPAPAAVRKPLFPFFFAAAACACSFFTSSNVMPNRSRSFMVAS